MSPFFVILYPDLSSFTLVLSDEIAQDEEDAEDYDMDALEHRTRAREEDDNATLVGSTRGALQTDRVVFEIGDEDEDDPATPKRQRPGSSSDCNKYLPLTEKLTSS